MGEEGGFAPPISDPKACLTLIVEAIDEAGYTGKIKIGVAAAADSFHHDDGRYDLDYKKVGDDRATDGSNMLDTPQLSALYKELLAEFPIVALEDPYHHEDFASFTALTADIGMKCQVVGDNLLVTNPKRVQKAVEERACNSLLVKVNQIGTVTETIEAVKLAKQVRVWGRGGIRVRVVCACTSAAARCIVCSVHCAVLHRPVRVASSICQCNAMVVGYWLLLTQKLPVLSFPTALCSIRSLCRILPHLSYYPVLSYYRTTVLSRCCLCTGGMGCDGIPQEWGNGG